MSELRHDAAVELQHIVLLTPEPEIAERLSVKDLAEFSTSANRVIQDFFAALPAGEAQELVVEIRIQEGGMVGAKLQSYPGLGAAVLDHLRLELLEMQGPAVRDGSVAYEAHFLIWADTLPMH